MALLNFTEASQTEIAALCGVTQQYVSKIAGTLQRVVTSTETRKDSRGRPQPKRKPRRKKLTPQEQKQLDECEATIAKHVTSSWGMHYAEMAILDLELISPTDSEREQAFAHVEQWIAGARQQQAA